MRLEARDSPRTDTVRDNEALYLRAAAKWVQLCGRKVDYGTGSHRVNCFNQKEEL